MKKGLVRRTAAIGVALALAAGCANEKSLNSPNLPPETYIAIGDSIRNPTVYMQTVRWWGEDKDGEVIGFEYRWFADPSEPGCPLPDSWVFTENTSERFDLPVTGGVRSHTIEVRAIDDQNEPDPEPARATFPVTNTPPTITIWDQADLPDTTLPAILVKWHADDPEGRETIRNFKVWLDGDEADAMLLAPDDTVASLGQDAFKGRYGRRTLSIVAIDTGCDTSSAVSHTWYVVEPVGRVLLVDDLSKKDYASPATSDRFYRRALGGCPFAYSILDIGKYGGMGYTYNIPEVFRLFDLVVWYNDPAGVGTSGLTTADEAFRDYVAEGGRFLLISMGAVGTGGALNDSTAFETFGIDSLYVRAGQTNFDCKRWSIRANSGLGLDSLRVSGLFPGAECMKVKPDATPLYYIPPGTINAAQRVDYYIGVMNLWQDGKAALITFPMSRADDLGNAADEFCKLVHLMLD
jgi:hypothetical protein